LNELDVSAKWPCYGVMKALYMVHPK
jgi:hypothetical protein